MKPIVGIIMGSDSDVEVMQEAAKILKQFEVPYEMGVYSAHRSPHRTLDYVKSARERGLKVIIAGAGSSAHLARVTAADTTLPVIGIAINSANATRRSRRHNGSGKLRRDKRGCVCSADPGAW